MEHSVSITIDDVEYELVETPHGKDSCKLCLLSPVCSMADGSALCQVSSINTFGDDTEPEIGTCHFL